MVTDNTEIKCEAAGDDNDQGDDNDDQGDDSGMTTTPAAVEEATMPRPPRR